MFKKTLDLKFFLQYDSGLNDEERIVVFYSEASFLTLSNSEIIILDGTFKIYPRGFLQVYTLHGVCFGRSFPLVYVLMKKKILSYHEKLFAFIQNKFN